MLIFQLDKILSIARGVPAFLKNSFKSGVARDAAPDTERHDQQDGNRQINQRRTAEQRETRKSRQEILRAQRKMIKSKRQELSRIKAEMRTLTDPMEARELKKRRKRAQQELFELGRELRAAKEGAEVKSETGALPDFVVIGAQKGGTTFLYHLLVQHPYVEPAASKEVHFFDNLFDLGVDWYRRCFPTPRWKDGRRTITGEATPYYLFHPHAAKRMAQVIPRARLIVLLRNPVDRAYSHYQMAVRNALRRGENPRKFEEALEVEEAKLRGEWNKMLEHERYDSFEHQRFSYLSRGVYVDQLLRWSEFFPREQMLVLKSEDLFEHPANTLKLVEDFLGLPGWEPEALGPRDDGRNLDKYERIKRNKGRYEEMDPTTRRRLEEYFEPHNQRLYEFLGADFGW